MTAKEIWYLWNGRIDMRMTKCFLSNGWTMEAGDKLIGKVLRPDFDTNIVAYTLGETRERVACDKCGGYGLVHGGEIFMLVDGESIPNFITEHDCLDCQGRGYIWKTGEKK